jgi:hypothetical protein
MIAIADEILDYENIPWKKYASKDSGILKYSAGSDFIWLEFKLDKVYYYTNASAGQNIINRMKSYADLGDNLGTYRNKSHPPYEARYEKRADGKYHRF